MSTDRSEVRYAHSGEVAIAYRTFGAGPIDLLYVGGFVSHLEMILDNPTAARFWNRIAGFARVIFFDKRNQGLSDAGTYTVEAIAQDALAVLDAVGVQRAAVLGISEGGSAATMLAATRPDRLTSMVQFGTYARMSRADDYPQGIPAERIRATWKRLIDHWGEEKTLEMWAPSMRDDEQLRRWWARLVRSGTSPGAARVLGEMYEELDVRPLLPLVRVPTLVLWRAEDRMVPPALSRTVAEGIPGAKARELPGEDHLFIAGDQDPLLDAIGEFLTGRKPEAPTERVLATVLFTDLVDSTRRAAELGDRAWRRLLTEAEQRWRDVLGRFGGRLVKTMGDGLLATFDGPALAARAAMAVGASTAELGEQIRAGIHTGEVELLRDDIGGIAVHIAARVEGAARAGEVTTTSTVKDLVIGSGLEFADRGTHTLKGVPGEWHLYAVSGDAEHAGPGPNRA